jgi:mono/diheme cytochrome c family protein
MTKDTVMQNSLRYLLAMALLAGCQLPAQTAPVTAVEGESWLIHLNRSFGDTSMGKTGRLGPGPQEEESLRPPPQARIYSSRDGVVLHGSDLYRLNCQGCHGESGLGAPPEINSVINPVRATSVPLVMARMKATGMDVTAADAAKLAQQSKAALMDRLHKGGESMPSFSQLNDAETRALLAYLKHLAAVPDTADGSAEIKESHARVGELIVRSTCHTCHSATGPDPGPQEVAAGAIPPLSTLTSRKNQSEFVRKVTLGAPVLMGTPATLYRGRMPVFFYLTEEEAADVYLYLTLYPPTEQTAANPLLVASLGSKGPSGKGPRSPRLVEVVNTAKGEAAESTYSAEFEWVALLLLAGLMTAVLAGGLIFTLREFKRLSIQNAGHVAMPRPLLVEPGPPGRMKSLNRTAMPLLYTEAKRSTR